MSTFKAKLKEKLHGLGEEFREVQFTDPVWKNLTVTYQM